LRQLLYYGLPDHFLSAAEELPLKRKSSRDGSVRVKKARLSEPAGLLNLESTRELLG
jgi:hypothetical protein